MLLIPESSVAGSIADSDFDPREECCGDGNEEDEGFCVPCSSPPPAPAGGDGDGDGDGDMLDGGSGGGDTPTMPRLDLKRFAFGA